MRARAVLALGLAPILALVFTAHPAAAGRLWCATDPLVSVDGRIVSISVAIPIEYVALVQGPTTIDITTPDSVQRQVLIDDVGYGHGTVITFVDGHAKVRDNQFTVTIGARIPVDTTWLPDGATVPLQVTAWADNDAPVTVTGTTDGAAVTITVTGR